MGAIRTIEAVNEDGTGTHLAFVQPMHLPFATDARINFEALIASKAPDPLSGDVVKLAVRKTDRARTLVLSRQAIIDNAVGGLGHFVITKDDRTTLLVGEYVYDVRQEQASGDAIQVVPESAFEIRPSVGEVGDLVTVPPMQAPFAQNPHGLETFAAEQSRTITIGLDYGSLSAYIVLATVGESDAAVGVNFVRLSGTQFRLDLTSSATCKVGWTTIAL